MGFADNVRSTAGRVGPVTLGILAALIAVTSFGVLDQYKHAALIAVSADWKAHPWTLLTYPFLSAVADALSVLFFICTISWILWVGGFVERELGSLRYGLVWLVSTLLGAICLLIGIAVAGIQIQFVGGVITAGPMIQIGVLTVIWGFRNRSATVMLFALLPLTGIWLAFITAVIVFVSYAHPPLLGIFACLPLAVAWAYVENRIPGLRYGVAISSTKYKPSKAQIKKEEGFFDDVRKREKERDERERLRKLFEASFDEDDKR